MSNHVYTYPDWGSGKDVSDYASALAHFNKIKPWRGQDEKTSRPLGRRRTQSKQSTHIRLDDDGSVAFRLYDTDVVTYLPDGTITVISYPSSVTNNFARSFLPPNIRTHFGKDDMVFVLNHDGKNYKRYWEGARGYQLWNSEITLELRQRTDGEGETILGAPQWWPVAGTFKTFDGHVINRTKARKVLRATKYHKFANWLEGVTMLYGRELTLFKGEKKWRKLSNSYINLVEVIEDEDRWESVLRNMRYFRESKEGWGRNRWNTGSEKLMVNEILADARVGIYQDAGCFEKVVLDYVVDWDGLRAFKKREEYYNRV